MKTLKGLGVSRGLARGEAFILLAESEEPKKAYFPRSEKEARQNEWRNARQAAADELDALVSSFSDKKDERVSVFLAQREMLFDEEIEAVIEASIDKLLMPDYAVGIAFDEFIGLVERTSDALIAERADDLRDVKRRLLRCLAGGAEKGLGELKEPAVIVARDLLVSDTARLEKNRVFGIITERGGATSHTAIIARALGIPAVVGVYGASEIITADEEIILDGETGEIEASPDSDAVERFNIAKEHFDGAYQAERSAEKNEARLKSGEKIEIGLNAEKLSDLKSVPLADFVGLLRTEFLYINSPQPPTQEEQFAVYSSALANMSEKPLTLRLLDIGGDKNPAYLASSKEENPFLGKRGIRFLLDNKQLFKTQLRAALRAGANGRIKLMLPMVSTVDEVRASRAVFEEAKEELAYEKLAFDDKTELGVMIETPSAALGAEILARETDFASIGTNDLTQYLFAADRLNASVGGCLQPLSPIMLKTLSDVINTFSKAGKEISVCGELAGEPVGALLLVGLGLRKLSMNAASIGRIKLTLSKVTLSEAEAVAKEALSLSTQGEVEKMMKKRFAFR